MSTPQWAEDVATRAAELVADSRVREHFKRMLRDWKAGRDPHERAGDVELLPRPLMTLAEKYAALAAIHDATWHDAREPRWKRVKPIDPWRSHKRDNNLAAMKAGFHYLAMRHRAREVTDGDHKEIEATLRDVEADLRARGLKIPGRDSPPDEKATAALKAQDRAIGLLVTHPDWTNKQIAAKVPCHRRTLGKWLRFREARRIQRGTKGSLPHGSKDGETGDVEAWDDE